MQPSVLVLVVDHNDDTRLMYGEYLRHLNYDVDEASDACTAFVKALSRQPQVIVTDTRLTDNDGVELCQLLRYARATSTIPLIVVTADAFPPTATRVEGAVADVVLTKPCLPSRLEAEIRRVTRTRAAVATGASVGNGTSESREKSHYS